MVVFLDLEDEAEPPELGNGNPARWMEHHDRGYAGVLRRLDINAGSVVESGMGNGNGNRSVGLADEQKERENPNKNLPITEALGCYP